MYFKLLNEIFVSFMTNIDFNSFSILGKNHLTSLKWSTCYLTLTDFNGKFASLLIKIR